MSKIEFRENGLFIDNKEFYLISGDIHYYRIYPGGIKRRLELMKAFGLTAVQTYVPWNIHEPEKGEFKFDGICDFKSFLEEAEKLELKVLFRPAPYICSEWDMGGLPSWLLREEMNLRTSDERYLRHVREYYEQLCREFVPYLSTNGGPIIAVTIENEYGSYGNDYNYLLATKSMLEDNGVDVPFYTTDGYGRTMLTYGSIKNVWCGVNYRVESAIAIKELLKYQKDKPPLVGEYWSGRSIHWGEHYAPRDIEQVAKGFQEGLEAGGLMNFYMFAGGTNFGFMNGANYGRSFSAAKDAPIRYIPHVTSYDEDALLNEQGLPTPKYFACRKVLWKYLGKPEPEMPIADVPTQIIKDVKLTESITMWDCLPNIKPIKTPVPPCMEDIGQDYGYCLYRTIFTGCGEPMKLRIPQIRDRVDVFVNSKYRGTMMRDRDNEPIILSSLSVFLTTV